MKNQPARCSGGLARASYTRYEVVCGGRDATSCVSSLNDVVERFEREQFNDETQHLASLQLPDFRQPLRDEYSYFESRNLLLSTNQFTS